MKVAVVGKGGSGKTTAAAVIARSLAGAGRSVVALDCDTNPNLGISLGLGDDATDELTGVRQALDEGNEEHAGSWDEVLERFGVDGPDGVRLAVVSKIDTPEPGCPCCGVSPEQLLGLAEEGDAVVVADFEAGIGTLTRMGDRKVDIVLVVVEPTAKSLEVGSRGAAFAREQGLGRVVVVANRVRDEADIDAVRRAFPGDEVVMVPDDRNIEDADRHGRSPVDTAPDSGAVRALQHLARSLVAA